MTTLVKGAVYIRGAVRFLGAEQHGVEDIKIGSFREGVTGLLR